MHPVSGSIKLMCVFTYVYVYVLAYIYVCMCVCVCSLSLLIPGKFTPTRINKYYTV